jgi:hypothetical protein
MAHQHFSVKKNPELHYTIDYLEGKGLRGRRRRRAK